ncbi:hypothetical protein HGRIS_003322 [Hohenbuehelia grisea]|uniref:Uncharacterized protein n=1 Tax=Hohenbuehelia grisea TaxID=104357 RepID=A0ABR3JFA9_9AGAR
MASNDDQHERIHRSTHERLDSASTNRRQHGRRVRFDLGPAHERADDSMWEGTVGRNMGVDARGGWRGDGYNGGEATERTSRIEIDNSQSNALEVDGLSSPLADSAGDAMDENYRLACSLKFAPTSPSSASPLPSLLAELGTSGLTVQLSSNGPPPYVAYSSGTFIDCACRTQTDPTAYQIWLYTSAGINGRAGPRKLRVCAS